MNVTIGSHTFTAADYDQEGDVLFLYNADPALADSSDATPEGDCVSYDHQGQLISIEITNARYRLEHDGQIKLTIPERLNLAGDTAAQLVAA